MTIYVGSLKYTPVYKSLCFAFGKACEKKGYNVKYLLSMGYEYMLSKEEKEKAIFIGHSTNFPSLLEDSLSIENRNRMKRVFSDDPPTHIYMHNYHPLNHFLARLSERHQSIFIYHVHEPYVQNKGHHGGFHQYWLHLFEYLQEKLLEKTDVTVVSSNEASHLFDLRYPNFSGKKVLIPLMLEDLGNSISDRSRREFVTFVGPPVPAKNPEKFLETVRWSNEHEVGLKFLMISNVKPRDPRYINVANLEINCASPQEYGALMKRSITLIAPYKRQTQSASVLVSYMYGTPVVSSNVGGLPEFVSHKQTGYLLDVDAKAKEWVEGVCYVRDNFSQLSKTCRSYFLENFAGEKWIKYLDSLSV